jgi:hypothetical protein
MTRTDHHDYEPMSRVKVQVSERGRTRWLVGTFLGTNVGIQMSAATFLVVETRDGRVWPTCCPECVRAA